MRDGGPTVSSLTVPLHCRSSPLSAACVPLAISPPSALMLSLIVAVAGGALVLLLAWIVLLEGPRLASLLEEVKVQQHARVFEEGASKGEDAESAAAHAESLEFVTRPLTLTVPFTDVDGSRGELTGTAEVLSILEPNAAPNRPLFLMIPGNPGLVAFYKLFLLYLHRLTGGKVEFRAVSFVGHTSQSRNEGRSFPFTFQLAFMDEVMRLTLKEVGKRHLFLAGHSVGAFTVLHMLNSLSSAADRSRVSQAFMLAPTIMHIASTPNGIVHTPVLRFLRPVALSIVSVVSCLPFSLQKLILAKVVGLHPYEIAGAQGLLRVETAAACLRMAHEEMQQIGSLDLEAEVRPHLNRLYFVWALKDRWAPLSQLQQLKMHFRHELRYELAHKDAAHAFVVGGAHLVAPVVAKQLQPFI